MTAGPVLSVVTARDNGTLIAEASKLWVEADDNVCDVTFGRGRFWTRGTPARFTAHDLVSDGVDFRALPHDDNTFDVIVFDPPYIPQGGRTTSTLPDFLDRYGLADVPGTTAGLLDLMAGGVSEAFRVLTPGGRLLFKCADYVNGGKFVTGRHNAVNLCLSAGFQQVDEFVHHSGTGPQPSTNRDGTPRRQLHSRRAHSFLCVFQKPSARLQRKQTVWDWEQLSEELAPFDLEEAA